MKINTKKIMSLILAGGIALMPTLTKAESINTNNIESIILSNVKQDITFNEYCQLVLNLKSEFEKANINIELNDLYSLVYIANIDFINNDLKEYLINNNIISDDANVIMTEALKTISIIATHNGNIYNDYNCTGNLNSELFINTSTILTDKNDQDVLNGIEIELNEFVKNIDNKDLYNSLFEFFTGFNRQEDSSINELSNGANFIANMTIGNLYHSQIGYMHNNIANNVELDTLESYLFDISNLMNVLNKTNCNKK